MSVIEWRLFYWSKTYTLKCAVNHHLRAAAQFSSLKLWRYWSTALLRTSLWGSFRLVHTDQKILQKRLSLLRTRPLRGANAMLAEIWTPSGSPRFHLDFSDKDIFPNSMASSAPTIIKYCEKKDTTIPVTQFSFRLCMFGSEQCLREKRPFAICTRR